MSADGRILDHDILSVARDLETHAYLHMLAISCLYYDHCITLTREIEYLWARPKSHSSYWFFLNRYFAFLANLSVTVLGFAPLSESSCLKYHLYRQILLIVNQVLICALLTLRIYALYRRSKRILAIMLSSFVLLAGVACYVMFGQESAPAPQLSSTGCNVGISRITAIRLAGAWEALFAYDSIIFTLTLWKTIKERKERRATGINIALVDLLLRDGAIYYAVMALCNLANIMTFYFTGPFLRGSLSTFASSISATMMSRLMLNLHRTADEGINTTQITNTHFDYAKYHTTQEPVELDTIWSSRDRRTDPPLQDQEERREPEDFKIATGSDLTAVTARHRRASTSTSHPPM